MQNQISTMRCADIHVNQLEQVAYGHVTSHFISCDNGFEGTWYERYQFLTKCVSEDTEPDGWAVWEPFETWDWSQIVEQIDSDAKSLISTMNLVLEYAKKGIVLSAKDCSLGSDMKQLNMIMLVDRGSKEE